MYATERHEHIAQLITTDGRVSVVDLARRFEVTTETVRRDLDQLERAGLVRRVHGGAVSRTRVSTAESSLAERSLVRSEAKDAIARSAVDLLPAELRGSVYLDAGTTTAALATYLAAATVSTAPLEVVTHSMTVAHLLAGAPGLQVTAIGGRVRGLTAAAVGAGAVAAVGRLRPDIAFLGTNGLSAGFGLSTPDPDEAAVKEAIVRGAGRVVVLADSEKFDAELLVSFAQLSDIDVLVTDAAPTGPLADALAAADVEVVLA
ncbi:DeoR/GlpR family DNA-binding transcription regulator [Microbacterium sp. W1N]|uniref:DeoR/GlpR family DNA-binding transcription regulator n=1 Tax=Microbacterium festucae TaxID=2977531 RepID=UPI0021BF356A|nr:DeoR/GlpR family DNA-binding transcription regulator [Microbacterium festucae]MCT9820355.1 DeoR/GlpR family DNA-binding transcription regulator [Microbacterium festucae]